MVLIYNRSKDYIDTIKSKQDIINQKTNCRFDIIATLK